MIAVGGIVIGRAVYCRQFSRKSIPGGLVATTCARKPLMKLEREMTQGTHAVHPARISEATTPRPLRLPTSTMALYYEDFESEAGLVDGTLAMRSRVAFRLRRGLARSMSRRPPTWRGLPCAILPREKRRLLGGRPPNGSSYTFAEATTRTNPDSRASSCGIAAAELHPT